MFHRVRPQWVRHSDGYEVYSVDRFTIGYSEPGRRMKIAIDPASVLVIYLKSLSTWETEEGNVVMTEPERLLVLERVIAGLAVLDDRRVELFE